MSERVEGGDDGVVYLGRNSFKMKVGVRMTPPGTPATPRATAAPTATGAPTATAAPTPAATATPTPPPTLKTPVPVRRASGAYVRTPAPPAPAPSGGGAATRTMVIGGLCMIAFSCGVMCTIAVDRFWPRARAQCVGAPSETTGGAP